MLVPYLAELCLLSRQLQCKQIYQRQHIVLILCIQRKYLAFFDPILSTYLLSHFVSLLCDDWGAEAVLQWAVADEHKAEFVWDGEEIEQEP